MPIPGWEEGYEVSDLGRVRSKNRIVVDKNGVLYERKGTVLSQHLNKSKGYMIVELWRHNVKYQNPVHQIVALAFLGSEPELQVRHLDDDKLNNNLFNLSYGTNADNQLDSVRNGTHGQSSKEKCIRGHKLEAPNLTNTSGDRKRFCLACSRARATAHNHNKRYGIVYTEKELQEIADQKYLLIEKVQTARLL